MKTKTRNFIKLFGICLLFIGAVLFLDLFVNAYTNPDYRICIDINYYGEAQIEMFFLFPVMFIFGTWAMILILKDYWNLEETKIEH